MSGGYQTGKQDFSMSFLRHYFKVQKLQSVALIDLCLTSGKQGSISLLPAA